MPFDIVLVDDHKLVRDGVDAVTEVPKERWNAAAFYDPNPAAPGKVNTRWGGFVYNVDLVRQLCRDIANEKDPQKERDLVAVLQAVIREDQEEIRVRMAFLAKKYADAISDSKAAD